MKRFPLRLRVALAKARLFHGRMRVRFLRTEEVLHAESRQPVSHAALREMVRGQHSIVWIGGSEPLVHPGIGHLAKLIVQSGHFLFLETDGVKLRQRIHEFQPSSRFYLAVRFLSRETQHDRLVTHPGSFRAAMEGIRAAQLSGFLVCAKVEMLSEDSAGLVPLCAELQGLDLDGMVISASAGRGDDDGLLPFMNSAWLRLSRFVESARSECSPSPPQNGVDAQVAGTAEKDCEEVAQVQ